MTVTPFSVTSIGVTRPRFLDLPVTLFSFGCTSSRCPRCPDKTHANPRTRSSVPTRRLSHGPHSRRTFPWKSEIRVRSSGITEDQRLHVALQLLTVSLVIFASHRESRERLCDAARMLPLLTALLAVQVSYPRGVKKCADGAQPRWH